MTDKYQELKDDISKLFEGSTDTETIKQAANVASKIDALKSENEALAKSKGDLLQDYKALVLTASYKPASNENTSGADSSKPKDFNEALKSFAKTLK